MQEKTCMRWRIKMNEEEGANLLICAATLRAPSYTVLLNHSHHLRSHFRLLRTFPIRPFLHLKQIIEYFKGAKSEIYAPRIYLQRNTINFMWFYLLGFFQQLFLFLSYFFFNFSDSFLRYFYVYWLHVYIFWEHFGNFIISIFIFLVFTNYISDGPICQIPISVTSLLCTNKKMNFFINF